MDSMCTAHVWQRGDGHAGLHRPIPHCVRRPRSAAADRRKLLIVTVETFTAGLISAVLSQAEGVGQVCRQLRLLYQSQQDQDGLRQCCAARPRREASTRTSGTTRLRCPRAVTGRPHDCGQRRPGSVAGRRPQSGRPRVPCLLPRRAILPSLKAAPRLTVSQHATPCAARSGCGSNFHFSGAPGLDKSSA
jgi:hypothetical protein